VQGSRGKRVILISGSSFPSCNAVSRRISSLAAKLAEKGYSVRVFSSIRFSSLDRTDDGSKEYSTLQIIPVVPSSNIFLRLLNMLSSFFVSINLLLIGTPDLIILTIPPWEVALGFNLVFLLLKSLLKRNVKLVYDYRDSLSGPLANENFLRGIWRIDKRLLSFLLKLMSVVIDRSDLIVCSTEFQKNSLIKTGFGADRIRVVLNGADTGLFKPVNQEEKTSLRLKYGLPVNSFVLVVVSSSAWDYYRLEPILEALSMLRDSRDFGHDLLLMTVGVWTRHLRTYFDLADRLGIKDNVNHLGEIPHEKMPDVLNAADVGMVPYANLSVLKETLPVKLFEYSSCKLPVIVTAPKESIIERVVQEHQLGFVCFPGDVGCLTKAIEELCMNTELRNEIKRKCRVAIEKKYNRTALSEKYVLLIENLLLTQKCNN
jgi:glycosyltransferase involved in cell wall biosynthesis